MKTKLFNKLFILFIVGAFLFLSAFIFTAVNNSVFALESSSEININVDILSYDKNNLPNGVVEGSYPVFEYQAVDSNGNEVTDSSVLVYNPNDQLIPVKNMRFSTATAGKYKIVYKAIRGIEQVSYTLIVEVVPENEYTAPTFEFTENIVDSVNAGEQVIIPSYNYYGGNGELTLSNVCTYGDDKKVVIENYGSYDYFIPTVSGTYTVKYFVTDITGTVTTTEEEVVVTDGDKPILSAPSIPAIAYKGETVSFMYTEATVYIDGKQICVPVKVSVGDTDVTSAMSYKFENAGEYTVKYEAVNVFSSAELSDKTASYSQTIKVVDLAVNTQNELPYIDGYLNLNNFTSLWNEEGASTIGLNESVYVLKANGSNPSATFKTAIPNQLLTAKIGFENYANTSSSISVSFVDSVNANEKLTVTFKYINTSYATDGQKVNDNFDVYVGGVKRTTVSAIQPVFDVTVDVETGIVSLGFETGSVMEPRSIRKIAEEKLKEGEDGRLEDKDGNDVYYSTVTGLRVASDAENASRVIEEIDGDGNRTGYLNYENSSTRVYRYVIEKKQITEQVELTNYNNGTKFKGFDSESAYFSLSAEDVDNNFIIKFYQICTQGITDTATDASAPLIFTKDNFNVTSSAELGEDFIIQPVTAFDLFDKNVSINVTIIAPNREILLDSDIKSASSVKLSQYGSYRLIYTAKDSSNNEREFNCVIVVVDRESPMISEVSLNKNVSVGDTLELPLATVTDNATAKVVNWIYVTCDNYRKVIVYDGKTITTSEFTFDKAGVYVVSYAAIDDAGNTTVVKYTVECE